MEYDMFDLREAAVWISTAANQNYVMTSFTAIASMYIKSGC